MASSCLKAKSKTRKDSPCGSHPSMQSLLRRFNRSACEHANQMGTVFRSGMHIGIQSLSSCSDASKGRYGKVL